MTNPRILDIQTQVIDVWQSGSCPSYFRAVEVIAEKLDLSTSLVDSCVYFVANDCDETLRPVDPFDTSADDWSEDYWR